ncbi:hypothetical protein BH24ACI1_BH24ACI1_03900 [soil metagenome]
MERRITLLLYGTKGVFILRHNNFTYRNRRSFADNYKLGNCQNFPDSFVVNLALMHHTTAIQNVIGKIQI